VKIAVTSQNFRSVTGHAGKSRRFIIFDVEALRDTSVVTHLDLPLEMTFHEFAGGKHPLDDVDVILTASAGQGFIAQLAQRGVQVITCGESDPHQAVQDYLAGEVKPVIPHEHQKQHGHAHGDCCCTLDEVQHDKNIPIISLVRSAKC
jgi:predicted Fe-Mo cluster-binding NifX family protein